MEKATKDNATTDKVNPQADTLTDLALADEQTDETKGGAVGGHVKVFDGTSFALIR